MLKSAFRVVWGLLLAFTAEASDCTDAIRRADFLLEVTTGGGNHFSAVLIAPDLAITVAHGLPVNHKVFVRSAKGGEFLAVDLLGLHWGYDLALLKLNVPMSGAIGFAKGKVAESEVVWSSSLNRQGSVDVRVGVIESSSLGKLVTTPSIEPGGSGGALLRCASEISAPELVGVLQAYRVRLEGTTWQNRGVSISLPVSVAEAFVKQAGR